MGGLCLLLALAAGFVPYGGPGPDFTEAVLLLSGASAIEELDEQELERYRHLAAHPLDLNSAGRGRLLASGLLSRYQTASLLDYRESGGDILSYAELAMVDGFGPEFAEALRHFTVLRSRGAPGQAADRRVRQDFLARASVREKSGTGAAWGLKYGLRLGETAELNWAARTTYGVPKAGPGCASIALQGRRIPGRLVLGDYYARFGQGLVLWSGFSLSGVPSVASFRKNGTGVNASSSFTRQMHGAAVSLDLGRWDLSAGFSWPGTVLGNVSRHWNSLSMGMTGTFDTGSGRGAASLDFKAGTAGLSIFGEAAAESLGGSISPAGTAGIIWTPHYGTKLAALARYYSPGFSGRGAGAVRSSTKVSDEAALALGFESRCFSGTADYARHPGKGGSRFKAVATASLPLVISADGITLDNAGGFATDDGGDDGKVRLKPGLRLAVRASTGERTRTDLRGELHASRGPLRLNARYNALWCRDFAWLWNAEGGLEKERFTSYLRFTLFKVDDWDDRIYAYERDLPGAFSVPAFYGRGFSLSAVAGLKLEGRGGWRHRFSLKAGATRYPWTEPAKAGAAEFRIQYSAAH